MKKKEPVNAEKALALLRREGIEISLEEAESVLHLLRIIAKIVVNQHLRDGDS